jgi:hypothetical protein
MAETWPPTLQDKLNEEAFSFTHGETKLRSDMDVGPAKVRRRYTKSVDPISCTIDVTQGEYSDFDYFYRTTLNGGVNQFTFDHPITGVPTDFRIVGTPQTRSIGGGNFRVSMQWEILP